jgi:hypothetical protein
VFTTRYELNLYVIIRVNFSSLSRGMAPQSDFSPRRPQINARLLHVRFLVHKVALEQVFFLIEYFGFPRSLFHQCSILIFIYMLLLPKGQTGEAWQPSKSIADSGIREHWVEKLSFSLCVKLRWRPRIKCLMLFEPAVVELLFDASLNGRGSLQKIKFKTLKLLPNFI